MNRTMKEVSRDIDLDEFALNSLRPFWKHTFLMWIASKFVYLRQIQTMNGHMYIEMGCKPKFLRNVFLIK